MTDTEKLDEILKLLRKIDGELGAIPEVQARRAATCALEQYQTQTQSNLGVSLQPSPPSAYTPR